MKIATYARTCMIPGCDRKAIIQCPANPYLCTRHCVPGCEPVFGNR